MTRGRSQGKATRSGPACHVCASCGRGFSRPTKLTKERCSNCREKISAETAYWRICAISNTLAARGIGRPAAESKIRLIVTTERLYTWRLEDSGFSKSLDGFMLLLGDYKLDIRGAVIPNESTCLSSHNLRKTEQVVPAEKPKQAPPPAPEPKQAPPWIRFSSDPGKCLSPGCFNRHVDRYRCADHC
jgi:DNA-directed RNA polymerase subunit RPC12/RpoP